MYHIQRYPYLSSIDVCSKKGQYNWPCFFQILAAWKLLGQSKNFHLIYRLPTHEFEWKENDPFTIILNDAPDYNIIWLEYDNGRLLMSVIEFIPLQTLIAAYCGLEEKRNVVIHQLSFDDPNHPPTASLHLDSIEYHTDMLYKMEMKAMSNWNIDQITIYVRDPNPGKLTPAEGKHGHIEVIYAKMS